MGYWVFGMPIVKHPISYHEPWGPLAPQTPQFRGWWGVGGMISPSGMCLEDIRVVLKESKGAGVVIASAGGLAASGHAAWELVEGRHEDRLDLLLPSNPSCLRWGYLHL